MEAHYLQELVVMFCLSSLVVLVCHRFRLPSIVGFLITGTLCGPSALGLVSNGEVVDFLAEVGVVFLLFTIGMEMSGKELNRLKRPIFIGGTAQVLLTVVGVSCLAAFSAGFAKGVVYGCLVALSSTAIVLSLLQQRALSESPQGRIALAILIFQDIAIVPMMLLIPVLQGGIDTTSNELLRSMAKSLVVLGSIFLLAKYALPRLMLSVVRSRSRELMLMTTLGLCLAVAFATSYLGLSLSLGAFLAGLLLAESDYSLSVMENVLPFKDVFTSIFFISIGMLLDMEFFIIHIVGILALALGLILFKMLITVPAVLAVGYSMRTAIIAAFSLAQIGEFSFVLARSAVSYDMLSTLDYQYFLAASILTMTLTPALMTMGVKVADRLVRKDRLPTLMEAQSEASEGIIRENHLIIIGFGVGGKNLARVARQSGIAYVISEMNPDTVAHFRNLEPIHHGDASFPLVLEHLGIAKARVLCLLTSDPAGSQAIIAHAKRLNPAIHIVVRARFLGEMELLRKLGAHDVVPEEFEASIEVFSRVLNHFLVPRQRIDEYVSHIRAENYGFLREESVPSSASDTMFENLPNLQVAAYTVEEGASLEGKALADSNLRSRFHVTVAGIQRGVRTLTELDAQTRLEMGDVVYLFGSQHSLQAVAELFCVGQCQEEPQIGH